MKEKPTIKELRTFYDENKEKALILAGLGIKGINDLKDVLTKGFSMSTDTDQHISLDKEKCEILKIIKKIDRQTEHRQIIPDYIIQLVERGYLKTDGITAIASLDAIAEFLYSLKLDNFNFKTLLQFRQHNGQPFSENTAKEAAKRANCTK